MQLSQQTRWASKQPGADMHTFTTTTGCAPESVEVSYEVDEDGQCFVEAVMWNDMEISGLLTDDVNADIEMECHADLRKRDKANALEISYDRGQARYEERMDT
jgi:hypothetical protein